MYVIAFFGLLMMILSIAMIINSSSWANGIVKFSEKPYFHPFEILSRLGFGSAFIIYSNRTEFPTVMMSLGYLLTAVGILLLFTPPTKHRKFAIWSAQKFKSIFRPAGICSFLFGAFLVYASLSGELRA